MSTTRWVFTILGILFLMYIITDEMRSCTRRWESKKFEEVLAEGKLTEAEEILNEMNTSHYRTQSGDLLVVEYLKIGELDKAKRLWDRNVARGDIAGRSLCKYLIEAGRVDEAWEYATPSSLRDHYSNAEQRYAYMVDVVTFYCLRGEKGKAYDFVRRGVFWFNKYIDNAKDIRGDERYSDYYSETIRVKLVNIIDQF